MGREQAYLIVAFFGFVAALPFVGVGFVAAGVIGIIDADVAFYETLFLLGVGTLFAIAGVGLNIKIHSGFGGTDE